MKKTLCILTIVALLGGCSKGNDAQKEGGAVQHQGETSPLVAPTADIKPAENERMPGFKKMKEELRAKGINPDRPTNEDFRKALTGGRE